MFNLMMGVIEADGCGATAASLLSTARACNNLAYCATVSRISDQHAALLVHIQTLLRSARQGVSRPLMRHLLAKRATLVRLPNSTTFKLRNGRRRVLFRARSAQVLVAAHGATHFEYDADASVVVNGTRLFACITALTPSQTSRTVPSPTAAPA